MKKIAILLMLFLGTFIISGCKDTNRDAFGFINTTIQTKEEIKEKLAFYIDRMLSSAELNLNVTTSSDNLFLATEADSDTYTRDELPPKKTNHVNLDMIDPMTVKREGERLELYLSSLDLCEEFVEDVFCKITIEDTNILYKVRNEGHQLFIEAYHSSSFINDAGSMDYVTASIIYIDMIDDQMRYERILDTKRIRNDIEDRSISYHLYQESGDLINFGVNLLLNKDYFYQKYDRATETTFQFSNTEGDLNFKYNDYPNDILYLLNFIDDKVSTNLVSFGFSNAVLRYNYSNPTGVPRYELRWNLLDISGWDKVVVFDRVPAHVYNQDLEVLEDFTTEVTISDVTSAETYIRVAKEDITENLLNLSLYGLSFNQITIEELNQGITYLEDNHENLLKEHGFSLNIDRNRSKLLDLFPYLADQDLVEELFEQLKNE